MPFCTPPPPLRDEVRPYDFPILPLLKKLKGVVKKEQREKLAEVAILSRLQQHLEVISMGRKGDNDVGRRRGVEKAKEQTGWLDVGQVAAKATIHIECNEGDV